MPQKSVPSTPPESLDLSLDLSSMTAEIVDPLSAKIADLERQLSDLESEVLPSLSQISEVAEAAKTDAYDAYQKKMRKINEEEEKNKAKLFDAESKLRVIDRELRETKRTQENQENQAKAKKAYELLAARLLKLAEAHEWYAIARPYQWTGIVSAWKAMEKGHKGFNIFDDRGLGKTLEATAFMLLFRDKIMSEQDRNASILWVTKKSLIRSSSREILRTTVAFDESRISEATVDVAPLQGSKSEDEMMFDISQRYGAITVCNYERLTSRDFLREHPWDLIVIDEVHSLKNGARTQKWQSARDICHRPGTFSLFLSGTPIHNRATDMWAYLHLQDPELFPTPRRFEDQFAYWDGQLNMDILMEALGDRCILRDKNDKEVAMDIPKKNAPPHYIPMGPIMRPKYLRLVEQTLLELPDDEYMPVSILIAKFTRLRQMTVDPTFTGTHHGEDFSFVTDEAPKVDYACAMLEDLFQEDEQSIVWSASFSHPIQRMAERLDGMTHPLHDRPVTYYILDGKATQDDVIDDVVADFQQKKYDVLLCMMGSVASGHNMNKSPRWPGGASHAIFLDLYWNPAINEQAMDRIHRADIPEPVFNHIIHMEDSFDQYMAALLADKAKIAFGFTSDSRLRGSEWKEVISDLIS